MTLEHGIPDILARIAARKQQEVAERVQKLPLTQVQARIQDQSPTLGFAHALQRRHRQQQPAVIAEIKKASPSQGVIRADFDPVAIALDYQKSGATCLSVLTDIDFFQGSDAYLQAVRDCCDLPILRKDFTISLYQIYEARMLGADAILLIAACLTDQELQEFAELAKSLGLDVLLEVHDAEEFERALKVPDTILGINNRNLRTFEVDVKNTIALHKKAPSERLLVTESGIRTTEDVQLMLSHGIYAFLVGEKFMREPSPGQALQKLFANNSKG